MRLILCNADGNLTVDEIQKAVSVLIGKDKSREDVEKVVALYDINKEGSIQFNEFVIWLTGRDIKKEFDSIDKDKSTT